MSTSAKSFSTSMDRLRAMVAEVVRRESHWGAATGIFAVRAENVGSVDVIHFHADGTPFFSGPYLDDAVTEAFEDLVDGIFEVQPQGEVVAVVTMYYREDERWVAQIVTGAAAEDWWLTPSNYRDLAARLFSME